MRWSHDHHRGAGSVLKVSGWHNLCKHGVVTSSTSPPVILKVSASRCLPHLQFGAIGILGLHESGCILEFQLHPHWLVLEMIVGDGPGAENLSQLQCSMWLVALPY